MICEMFKILKTCNNVCKIEHLYFTEFWSLNIIMVWFLIFNSIFWISGLMFSCGFFFACFKKLTMQNPLIFLVAGHRYLMHRPMKMSVFFVVIPPEQQATRSRTYIYIFLYFCGVPHVVRRASFWSFVFLTVFVRITKAEGTAAFGAEKQRESAQTLWRTIKNPEGRHKTREKERRATKTCFLRARRTPGVHQEIRMFQHASKNVAA